MTDSLKQKTGTAMFWSFLDKGGQQLIQLIFAFILWRLIDPSDFGLVAVLAIFTAVANILQESGFSSALIRKSKVLDEEYSSVFYFNISISIGIYALLFFCAPLIGDYFDKPILVNLSRVIFLSFVFNAFGIIQNINLIRNMDFKTNSQITLLAGVISGIIAIVMAFLGYGVWSLVAQLVIQSFVRSLFLWIFIRWIPKGGFVGMHIKSMSRFSVKLLFTALLNHICANIYSIIIGKYFSFTHTGLYSQANKLNNIPQSVIGDGIKNVAYPLLSKIGGGEENENKVFRKVIRAASFISFPVSMMLVVMAKPIIVILFPAKWIDAAPILQILAIGGAVYPQYCLVSTLLQYKGKAGRFFILELIRNVLSMAGILISIKFGVLGLVTGISIVNILSFVVGISMAGKSISYSFRDIFMDISPYLAIASVAFLPLMSLPYLGINSIYLLFAIQLTTGSLIYLLITKVLGSAVLKDSINLIKQLFK